MAANREGQPLASTMSAVFTGLARVIGLPLPALFTSEKVESHINTLPAELFLDILLATLDLNYRLMPQLRTLARVCKYWLYSIISDSRFWRAIDLEDIHFASMIVGRNSNGPLAIRCRGGSKDPIEKFLEVARGQAHRCDSLELAGCLEERDLQLFDTPTPALVTLLVDNYNLEKLPLQLSPTIAALRHVHVSSVLLPWNSPSLAKLKSITIEGIGSKGPSLPQIITILAASPELEWFGLCNMYDPPTPTDDVEVPKQTISLPTLRGLYLLPLDHSSSITQHLLETIDAPKCYILEASVSYEFIQSMEPAFLKLTTILIPMANHIDVTYWGTEMKVAIQSPKSLYNDFRFGWRYGGSGGTHIDLTIGGVPYPSNAPEQIISVLGLRQVDWMEVQLTLYRRGVGVDSAGLFGDHLTIWNSATRLHFNMFYGLAHAVADLRFLANPVVENGLAWWPCPRLTHINLDGPVGTAGKEVADAVLEFLEKRSADRYPWRRDVSVAWDTPVQLEYIEAGEVIIKLIQGVEFTEGIELVKGYDFDRVGR